MTVRVRYSIDKKQFTKLSPGRQVTIPLTPKTLTKTFGSIRPSPLTNGNFERLVTLTALLEDTVLNLTYNGRMVARAEYQNVSRLGEYAPRNTRPFLVQYRITEVRKYAC